MRFIVNKTKGTLNSKVTFEGKSSRKLFKRWLWKDKEEIVHLYWSVRHSWWQTVTEDGHGWPRFIRHSESGLIFTEGVQLSTTQKEPQTRRQAGKPEQDTQLAPQPRQKLESLKLFIFPSSSSDKIGMVSVPLSRIKSSLRANQISKLSNNYTDHAVRACCLTRMCECLRHSQGSPGIRAELQLDVLQGYFRRTESNCHKHNCQVSV